MTFILVLKRQQFSAPLFAVSFPVHSKAATGWNSPTRSLQCRDMELRKRRPPGPVPDLSKAAISGRSACDRVGLLQVAIDPTPGSLKRRRFQARHSLEPAAWKLLLNLLVSYPVRRSARWAVQEQTVLAAAMDHKHRGRATYAAGPCSYYPWNVIVKHRERHCHEQLED